MKIVYDADIKESKKEIEKIAFDCGILYNTAKLLYSRKIDTPEKAKRFLNPSKNGFYNPYLFKNMEDVVRRVIHAREKGENVLIFGDYDADGISATTVLYNALKIFGITARTIIPEREEGYGLNVEKILLSDSENNIKTNLVITVDCGVSDAEKIEILKNNDIDVIVTDHHEPPENLPDCLILNPKIAGSGYPFDGLCGAGVAYKLGYALIGDAADDFLDFVALATVSDSMELIDENRDVVAEGLKILNGENVRFCFKSLLGENYKTVTSQTLAFSVAPKINAGGRMGDAFSSLRLFLSESKAEISEKADLLKSYNVERQAECENIYREAKAKISDEDLSRGVITVFGENWNAGFTGIVASRLVEEYSRPVIVFGDVNGTLKGSARSVEGVNIYNIIASAKDILTTFGGHAQAAGVGVNIGDYPLLKERINDYFDKEYKDFKFTKTVHAEWKVDAPLSARFIREIELLEPFGVGNKRPVFGVDVGSVEPLPIKAGSNHYAFTTDVIDMLDFNGEKDVEILSLPVNKTVVFETNRSVYKNRESVKGFVKQIVADYSDLTKTTDYVISNELDKLLISSGNVPAPIEDFKSGDTTEKTIYIISDVNNLHKAGVSGIPVYLFEGEITGENALIVSPREIPQGYKNAVYLDCPARFIGTFAKTYCNFSLKGYNFIYGIRCEREDMAIYYKEISAFIGEEFTDAVKFYYKHSFSFDIVNYLFAIKVFFELGIITAAGKILTVTDVKTRLTDSVIYNKVIELKNL